MDYPVLSLTWGGWVATFAGAIPDQPGTHRVTLRRPTRPGQPLEQTDRTTPDPTARGLRQCLYDHVQAREGPTVGPLHSVRLSDGQDLAVQTETDEPAPIRPESLAQLQQADPTWFARVTDTVDS